VGPKAGLELCGKSRPLPGFDPQTVQHVASRYTNCAIPGPLDALDKEKKNSLPGTEIQILDISSRSHLIIPNF